jgi:hypothetical protein
MRHLTIRGHEDLARLTRGGNPWQSIGVEAEGLDPTESRQLADALARGERPCGCIGARNGLAAGLVLAALLLVGVEWMSGRWAFAVFIVVFASMAGRRLEIARARYLRRRAARRLYAHFCKASGVPGISVGRE